MARHPKRSEASGIRVYLCDQRSPWRWGSYENRWHFHQNINGLLRQDMPKGTNLSVYGREALGSIADLLGQPGGAPSAAPTPSAEKVIHVINSLQRFHRCT